MGTKAKPIPTGYHTVTPVLTVHGAAKLIDFLKQAFDAKETFRLPGPDGAVIHAEVKIGDSMIMLGEATDQWKPMPATVALYVEDADAWYQRALRTGATSVREPSDQFYGDRSAGVKDFAGNHWWIHTRIEDVPPDEIRKRAEVWMKQKGS
ncbi:VOC family protein [Nitrospira sp. BLG_2]|uniref:VOC family protein n=1 Tax=Nitrospira sp. BLG_2 TaxID=3397507 RepID=UPI003B9A6D18